MTVYNDTLTQGIGVAQTGQVDWASLLTDDIGTTYRLIDVKAQPAAASDVINVAPALTPAYGAVVLERLRIALAQVPNLAFQQGLSDAITAADALIPSVHIVIAEGVGINLTDTAQLAVDVIEQLGLLPNVAAAALYGKTISETVSIAETLAVFFGVSLDDGVGIAEALASNNASPLTISEGVGIEEAELAPQLVLRVTAEDSIDITPEMAVSWLMNDTIEEGFEITAAYLSPGDSVTTWVMNTRSGAVSEYTNYAFNSFARMGNRYLAASETGLYELLGDDDAGTDIVSRIKSGFAQWANSKFTMFRAAYLAVRGGGDYVLKITTMDGKGLRARYFAFELISDGDDYDLESLEFVPISTDRRI